MRLFRKTLTHTVKHIAKLKMNARNEESPANNKGYKKIGGLIVASRFVARLNFIVS